MSTQIELYAGPAFPLFGTLPLVSVLRPAIERMLSVDLGDAAIRLELIEVLEEPAARGNPAVYNLAPDFGYAYVTVRLGGRVIYRHPHPLSELIAQPLQQTLAAGYPDQSIWGFRIAVPQLARRMVVPTPAVEGATVIRPYEEGQGPSFGIRRLADPDPPAATLSSLGVTADGVQTPTPVKVLISSALHGDILSGRKLSPDVEEGGFLTGNVYRDAEAEGCFIVSVTDAPPAVQTGASLLHFTFTGDSFTAVKRGLRDGSSRLLGWYHTHLFAATEQMGLSSIDVKLHLSTFTLPWQVAGLINIEAEREQRTLRFYVRMGDTMVACPFWVGNERN